MKTKTTNIGAWDGIIGESSPLRESVVRPALDCLDWPPLWAHMQAVGLNETVLHDFLGHMRRTANLISPYAYATSQAVSKRAAFYAALRQHVRETMGAAAEQVVAAEVELLDSVDRVYRDILLALQQSEAYKMQPATRVASCIALAELQYRLLTQRLSKFLAKQSTLNLRQGRLFLDDNGESFNPDAVVEAVVRATSSILVMEARINGWVDGTGQVVLPLLPKVGLNDCKKAAGATALALSWYRWRAIEERRRFLGGTLAMPGAVHVIAGMPADATCAAVYRLNASELYDVIANDRLGAWFMHTFAQLLAETSVVTQAAGIQASVPLWPDAFVSESEAHAAMTLSDVLSYDIGADDQLLGGLRLVEWLRGYAVLKALAKARIEGMAAGDSVCAVRRSEVIALLSRGRLSPAAANAFVAAVTLNRDSRDMFDAPIVQMAGGDLLIFGPALLTTNLATVVLSLLGTKGYSVERKGKAFEEDIMMFLRQQDIPAVALEFVREGQQFEFDVIAPWDGYVFLFECKSHSLSDRNAKRAYHCALQARSDGRQVRRLADALRAYPEVLRERTGIDLAGKELVACVLNALPYSLPGKVDGVYYTDASVLKRFFAGRYINEKVVGGAELNSLPADVAIYSQWRGTAPTPDDLLAQLVEPMQLRLMKAHTTIKERVISVGNAQFVVAEEFSSLEMSRDSVTAALGARPEALRD